MLSFVRHKLFVGYLTLVRVRLGIGVQCLGSFFSGYFSRSTEKYVVWQPNETFKQLPSMVVDRASTFRVGVSIRFGRQVRINSKLAINC